MALIIRGERSWNRDLLASVGGVDVKFLVVDSNALHAVFGGHGDLHVAGECEGLSLRDIEDVNGGVLEDEARLCGAENEPD